MTIQTDLVALLTPIVARIYPNTAPDAPTPPYVVYFRVVSVNENYIAGNGGSGNLSNTRFQIDIYSATYAGAQTTAASVMTALQGWSVQNVVNSEQDLYESDVKLHRVMIDISTWHY